MINAFDCRYRGKRVLVTGHTGFKGSWLCEWLLGLGAKVTGFSLLPTTTPSLFEQLELGSRCEHLIGDVRDLNAVHGVFAQMKPDFVFHLAAQPLVRQSYSIPIETYATNVMGTAHVLEAVRRNALPCTVVIVTTDKCYENREWHHGYREEDPMGGHDPYSSSKGAAELVVSAYRRSYFSPATAGIRVASVRAGNVIGGGDWALDRIVPDCMRALQRGETIAVRNKASVRPWQHVLEPLSGYLWLGARLAQDGGDASGLVSAFNFGPRLESNQPVAALVENILRHWPGRWEGRQEDGALHEARNLNLSIEKAFHLLQWQPVWDFAASIERTVRWYRACAGGANYRALTIGDLRAYTTTAHQQGLPWAAEHVPADAVPAGEAQPG